MTPWRSSQRRFNNACDGGGSELPLRSSTSSRALEQAGLLRQVAQRQARNCIERVVQATAYRYVISPEVLADLGKDLAEAVDRFSSAYLVSLAGRTIRELGALREAAQVAGKSLATLSMEADIRFADAADRNRFAEELAGAFAGLIQKYHRPESSQGRLFRFVVGGYPALLSKQPDEGSNHLDTTEAEHE